MAGKDTGIVSIHGKEYLTVAKRVQDFREKYKLEYAIVTEVVERSSDEVVMKATIQTLEGQVIATGYAEEKRTSSQINRTSALENAETSAIGRALAAFGLAGSEYASADEVANAIHQQAGDAPSAPRASSSKAPSEKQIAMIRALSNELGYDKDVTEQRIDLLDSSAKASEAIEKLQAAKAKKEEG